MSDISDDKDEDDKKTGTKDITGDGDRNGRCDKNTGTVGRSSEWLRFLSPRAQTEALGAMEKAKASSSISLRKNRSWGKVKVK